MKTLTRLLHSVERFPVRNMIEVTDLQRYQGTRIVRNSPLHGFM